MSKLVKAIFLIILCTFVFTTHAVGAEESSATANCDICGYCGGATAAPSDWKSCVKCVYPDIYQNIYANNPSADASIGETLKESVLPDSDQNYTVIGCISTKPGAFVGGISQLFFRMVGGIAFIFLLYGAFMIATSRADYEKLNQGKKIVFGSIAGLLFVLFATFIIQFIAVNVLKIPGFS